MCWQIALPLILSAAGTGLQAKARHDVVSRQEREAADNILKQAALNREADQRVSKTVQEVAASNPNAEQDKTRASYLDALRKSLPTRAGAVPSSGNVSSRFSADSDAATAQTEAEAVQNADTQAAIDAPTLQRLDEGVKVNDANVALSMLRGKSASQDYLSKLRMALIKPNPLLEAGGQLLGGAGSAYASGGGFGTGTDVWNDGSAASGLTAAQRRNIWMGN